MKSSLLDLKGTFFFHYLFLLLLEFNTGADVSAARHKESAVALPAALKNSLQ